MRFWDCTNGDSSVARIFRISSALQLFFELSLGEPMLTWGDLLLGRSVDLSSRFWTREGMYHIYSRPFVWLTWRYIFFVLYDELISVVERR